MATGEASGPDPIDVEVGERLRGIRRARGISQDALAGGLGLTFQQVQKYEKGVNRISASMLVRASRVLRVSTTAILPPEEEAVDRRFRFRAPVAEKMLDAFEKLDAATQRAVLNLTLSLAGAQGSDDPARSVENAA